MIDLLSPSIICGDCCKAINPIFGCECEDEGNAWEEDHA